MVGNKAIRASKRNRRITRYFQISSHFNFGTVGLKSGIVFRIRTTPLLRIAHSRTRPFAFTGVAARIRIHLLQSDFSPFTWTKPTIFRLLSTDSNTCLLSSRPGERRHGPNDERKTALQQVDAHIKGNPCKRKRSTFHQQETYF